MENNTKKVADFGIPFSFSFSKEEGRHCRMIVKKQYCINTVKMSMWAEALSLNILPHAVHTLRHADMIVKK